MDFSSSVLVTLVILHRRPFPPPCCKISFVPFLTQKLFTQSFVSHALRIFRKIIETNITMNFYIHAEIILATSNCINCHQYATRGKIISGTQSRLMFNDTVQYSGHKFAAHGTTLNCDSNTTDRSSLSNHWRRA